MALFAISYRGIPMRSSRAAAWFSVTHWSATSTRMIKCGGDRDSQPAPTWKRWFTRLNRSRRSVELGYNYPAAFGYEVQRSLVLQWVRSSKNILYSSDIVEAKTNNPVTHYNENRRNQKAYLIPR